MSGPSVAVLDYGSGNLRSVVRALARAGAEVRLTSDPVTIGRSDALVVPGVGAFAACMQGLAAVDAVSLISDWLAAERPMLGVCVGYQVLFESGTEHGLTTPGCGAFSGTVEQLRAQRLPHMGWNTLEVAPGSRYFRKHSAQDRFYFVHSYGVLEGNQIGSIQHPEREVMVHTTEHEGATVVAAIETGSLLATQFHPEKSADAGALLLKQWVSAISYR